MMQQAPGVYLISVVAQTLDLHPQTLRKYERAGFVAPLRMGALRAYSDDDVNRLRLIKHLVEDLGLNLAGVQLALKMVSELLALRRETAATGGAVERVDGLLAALGVRVASRRAADGGDGVEFDTGQV